MHSAGGSSFQVVSAYNVMFLLPFEHSFYLSQSKLRSYIVKQGKLFVLVVELLDIITRPPDPFDDSSSGSQFFARNDGHIPIIF